MSVGHCGTTEQSGYSVHTSDYFKGQVLHTTMTGPTVQGSIRYVLAYDDDGDDDGDGDDGGDDDGNVGDGNDDDDVGGDDDSGDDDG
ncbi:hypothetical protein STEG23_000307 [Scotinomys teguina]